MVSPNKLLIGASSFMGLAYARYSNTTSSTVSIAPKPAPTGFFSNVRLIDSYTGTNSSTDKDHWFLLEAEIYVAAGFRDDLYLTAPPELGSFPKNSFDLLEGSNVVGSISYNSSNIFTIKPEYSNEDTTAHFNVLTKLSESAKESITGPQTAQYNFGVSSGPKFVGTIDFVATNLTVSQTNARVNDDSSVTYNLDIPLNEYPGSFELAASFTDDTHKFDLSSTSVVVVLAVDNFNQPTKAINLTAITDTSDESTISLSMASQLSGGLYIRISYSTKPITDATIVETMAILNYPTLSSYKRDISVYFEDHVAIKSAANVLDYGETVTISSGTSPSPNSAINSTSETSTSVYYVSSTTSVSSLLDRNSTGTESTATLETKRTTSAASAAGRGNHTVDTFKTSTLSPATTLALDSNSSASTNGSAQFTTKYTYTVITRTDDGEYSVFTSFFPVATISSQLSRTSASVLESESVYVINTTDTLTRAINYTGSYTSAYSTNDVVTLTRDGEITVYTSLVPVATLNKHTTNSSLLTSTISDSSSVSEIVSYSTKRYLTNTVYTTTSNGKVIDYTSWYPVTTISTKVNERTGSSSSISSSGKLPQSTTVFTRTIGGDVSIVTTLVPASTHSSSRVEQTTSKGSSKSKATTKTGSTKSYITGVTNPERTTLGPADNSEITRNTASTNVRTSIRKQSVSTSITSNTTIVSSPKKTETNSASHFTSIEDIISSNKGTPASQSKSAQVSVSSTPRSLVKSQSSQTTVVFTSNKVLTSSIAKTITSSSVISTQGPVLSEYEIEIGHTTLPTSTGDNLSTRPSSIPIGATTVSASISQTSRTLKDDNAASSTKSDNDASTNRGSFATGSPRVISSSKTIISPIEHQSVQSGEFSTLNSLIGQSTLSSANTLSSQLLSFSTASATSTQEISIFDGGAHKLGGTFAGLAAGLLAYLL